MPTSEATPLTTHSATPSIEDQLKGVWKMIFTQENVQAAQGAMTDLHRSASEGDYSIRLLALLAGVALVISSFFGIIDLILRFRFPSAVLELYTFVMGCIMLLLESFGYIREQRRERLSVQEQMQLSTLENILRSIFKYALFLKFVWGRGGLYVLAGSLQLAQGSFGDYLIGGFVVLVGVLYIVVGRQTARKLTQLRQSLAQHTLRAKFQQADKNGNDKLTLEEFKHLVESLDMQLSRRELEVAFLCMDKRNAGYLTFEEFQNWWVDWEEGNDII